MNCKRKLLHCIANINFNKTCLNKKLVPNYARIKLYINNEAPAKTQTQTQTLRIKNEIKFLYRKKQQINEQLYHTHIHNANIWKQAWDNIEQAINDKLQLEMESVYLKQLQKINMKKIQNSNFDINNIKYNRVENHTNTLFTQSEIQLLINGLKYNLHQTNKKKVIETLALEAETAINSLNITEQIYYRHAVAKKLKEINKTKITHNTKHKEE
jgi:hypothetical protein